MTPTHVKSTLASMLVVHSESGSRRTGNVVVRVVRRARGGVTIDIHDGDVALTLDEAERIALIEALGGTR